MASKLSGFLERAGQPVLVIEDDVSPGGSSRLPELDLPPEHERRALSTLSELAVDWGTVLLITPNRATLRSAASMLPSLGLTSTLACWLGGSREPLVVVPRPDWPRLRRLVAGRADNGFLTEARFAGSVDAAEGLRELARQCVPGNVRAESGVVTAVVDRVPRPGLDPGRIVDDSSVADRVVPPDVVLGDGRQPFAVHTVTGRAPVLVDDPPVAPVDELVVNPVGFKRRWSEPTATLAADGTLVLEDGRLDLRKGVDEVTIARLRSVQGVRVEVDDRNLDAVVALAVAGVPVVAASHGEALCRLGEDLTATLVEPGNLGDLGWREEHSVLLRRAALRSHSTLARRRDLAAAAGQPFRAFPSVTVLLATRRPARLRSALEQIARQRDVDLEAVIATHGFSPDPDVVAETLGSLPCSVVELPAATAYGDVLGAALEVASGDVVLKVDDDDWYGADFVADLLWARRYSGADVVGTTAEYVYLEGEDVTLHRLGTTEEFGRTVAGGTIATERGLLREVGGFRSVHRSVDAQLLRALHAAGARIYRAHALGFVLHRGDPAGHTWQRPSSYFLDDQRLVEQWPGFHPSRIFGPEHVGRF